MRSCPRCLAPYASDAEFCALDGEKILETEQDPLRGATLDRYVLVERLGHGGMSAVYRARHDVLGKEYAIKIPYGEIAMDRALSERLRREAQTMAKIDHPNVVKVFDFGVSPAGLAFVVMELLDGRSLSSVIRQEGRIKPKRAAQILRQVALGLGAAHEHGFIHRDLKPSNVMLVGEKSDEQAKILDFGLVRITRFAADGDTMQEQLTRTGMTMGTPQYMSPEQIQGQPLTAKADLYSLGAVLYEMLQGAPPYDGSYPEIIAKLATGTPAPLPSSGGLEKLAMKMLDHDLDKRPEDAAAVVKAIDRLSVAPKAARKSSSGLLKKLAWAAVLSLIGSALWFGGDRIESIKGSLKELDRKIVEKMVEANKQASTKSGGR